MADKYWLVGLTDALSLDYKGYSFKKGQRTQVINPADAAYFLSNASFTVQEVVSQPPSLPAPVPTQVIRRPTPKAAPKCFCKTYPLNAIPEGEEHHTAESCHPVEEEPAEEPAEEVATDEEPAAEEPAPEEETAPEPEPAPKAPKAPKKATAR